MLLNEERNYKLKVFKCSCLKRRKKGIKRDFGGLSFEYAEAKAHWYYMKF